MSVTHVANHNYFSFGYVIVIMASIHFTNVVSNV